MSQEEYQDAAAYLQSENPLSRQKITSMLSDESFVVLSNSELSESVNEKRDEDEQDRDGATSSNQISNIHKTSRSDNESIAETVSYRQDSILQPYQLENYIKSIGTDWYNFDCNKKFVTLKNLLKFIPLYKGWLANIEKSFEEIKMADKLIEILKNTPKHQKDGYDDIKLKKRALKMCVNYSDVSEQFSQALIQNGAIEFFSEMLCEKTNNSAFEVEQDEQRESQRNFTLILFNMVNKTSADISRFLAARCKEVLAEYINSPDEVTQVASLMTIAYISGQDFAENLKITEDAIRLLTQWLKEAFEDNKEKRSKHGFQAVILCKALSKLAAIEKIMMMIKKKMTDFVMFMEVIGQKSDPLKDLTERDFPAVVNINKKKGLNSEKKKLKSQKVTNVNKIDLLLIGKTGNGKSATGNNILGREVFLSDSSCESVTNTVDCEVVEYNGRVIKVVDCPGVGDTISITDVEKAATLIMDKMKDAILLNAEGYHAFLLVVRYGGRFGAEDLQAIRILKVIFGPDFIKNYCILVVTCGDNFRNQEKIQKAKTFKKWCREQTGVFKQLLEECAHRVILFDNITKDKWIRIKQLKKLVTAVDNLQHECRRYTDANFQRVEADRERLLLQVKEPIIREDTLCRISLFLQKLKVLEIESPDEKLKSLKTILMELNEINNTILKIDNKTGVFNSILLQLDVLNKSITDKVTYERVTFEMAQKQQKFMEDSKLYQENLKQLYETQKQEEDERNKKHIEEAKRRREKEEERRKEIELSEEKRKKEIEEERRKVNETMQARKKEFDELLEGHKLETERRKELELEKSKLNDELYAKLTEIKEKEEGFLEDIKKERTELQKHIDEEKRKNEEHLESIKKENENKIAELKATQHSIEETFKAQMKEMENTQEQSKASCKKYEEKIKNLEHSYTDVKQKYDALVKQNETLVKQNENRRCSIS